MFLEPRPGRRAFLGPRPQAHSCFLFTPSRPHQPRLAWVQFPGKFHVHVFPACLGGRRQLWFAQGRRQDSSHLLPGLTCHLRPPCTWSEAGVGLPGRGESRAGRIRPVRVAAQCQAPARMWALPVGGAKDNQAGQGQLAGPSGPWSQTSVTSEPWAFRHVGQLLWAQLLP